MTTAEDAPSGEHAISPAESTQIYTGENTAIGGPTDSSWREQALTRIAELEDLAFAFTDPKTMDRMHQVLATRIHRHLSTAREAAGGEPEATSPDAQASDNDHDGHGRRPRLRRRRHTLGAGVSGWALERTASHVDAAEADLLRLAPPDYFAGQLPGILAHVRAHLPVNDPRRNTWNTSG